MNKQYLTVTALTKYIKRKLDTDHHLKNVLLQGEISNFNHHSRGHMYFTIKDDQTRIRAVMFANYNRRLKFIPENGMSILVKGEVSVFESFGQYQIYVYQMEPDGIGSLYMAYEQLKEKLAKQGLFDQKYKQPIPTYPEHIGIITSPTGAAIRDMLITLHTRYPIASVTIIPALVQGEFAPPSLSKAIEQANEEQFDVLIIGRGGGSIEELWSFNEEMVARAIFESTIPIVSAVGHETDMTISDYVADLRAPTPTSAATLVVPSQHELFDHIKKSRSTIYNNLKVQIQNKQQYLQRLSESYAFKYPDQLMKQKEQQLDQTTDLLEKGIQRRLAEKQQTYDYLQTRLNNQLPQDQFKRSTTQLQQYDQTLNKLMKQLIANKSNHLQGLIEKLSLLNPLDTMKRGYAIPYTKKGVIIKSRENINKNDMIELEITDGILDCKVVNVREKNNDE